MPTRYLKPGICDSNAIDKASPLAECLYYRLLVNVDDFGRLDARPAVVRSKCFPLKDTISNKDTESLLRELHDCCLIILYETNSCIYLQMTKWDNIPRSKVSKCPEYVCNAHTNESNALTILPVTVTGTVNRKPELKPKTETATIPGAEKSAPNQKTEIAASAKPETELQSACRDVWRAYSAAYFDRYGTEPVRNATVNTQVKGFVKRIGAEESPAVAAFFVQSNAAFYVGRGHSFGNLLSDAEKLRTEWATGRTMTGTRARQIDQSQANASVVSEAMIILEAMNNEQAP